MSAIAATRTLHSDVVPFMSLARLFERHRAEFLDAMTRVAERCAFISGPEAKAFEESLARWLGVGLNAMGCANGTDAITLAARGLGLPAESEAILPAMTFVATAEGLINAGIRIQLVDICEGSWLMDLGQLEKKLTPRTRLLVPVHLYGQMVPMDEVRNIADSAGTKVLEDAAQSHGSLWKNGGVGAWGDVAAFSFYPGKNLGAFGDAGAVVSRDKTLLENCRRIANHGGLVKYEHEVLGYNSRLDGLQAAVLRVKLKYIDEWNDARRRIAAAYRDAFDGIGGLGLPLVPREAKHTYHLFVVTVPERDRFAAFLRDRGIETGVHYPRAMHEHPSLRDRFAGERFPVAERLARHGISLPMCPSLTATEIERVIDAVRAFFR